jgi:exopolysaccharide biosynthesis protein
MQLYDTTRAKPKNRVEAQSNVIYSKSKKSRFKKKFIISFFSTILVFILTGVFLMYGPISYFRDLWVTTAMSTLHHQWLATSFFDKKTIDDILSRNRTIDPTKETDANAVTISDQDVKDNATTLPTSPADGEHIINGIGFTRLDTGYGGYQGWVIRVFDPSRIYMAMSQGYGYSGEKVTHMANRLGAYVGINAGGFIDVNGQGNGGKADKILISKGSLISKGAYSSTPHNIIGFDKAGKLLLTRCKQTNVNSLTDTYRDAVEFSPFLIVNGEPTEMVGNGGYGIQPRTAIGQTQKGVVIFVQIDGRNPPKVIGASVKELQSIFIKYGAYNAANLDGGSSSVFVFNGKVINNPSSSSGERFVPDAFLINPKK